MAIAKHTYMLRHFASVVALGATLTAPLVVFTPDASACSLPASGWYLFNNVGFAAANGVLALNYTCYTNCEAPPDPESFTLTRADGELVPGEVVLSGDGGNARYLVFRPEAGALTAGATYTAAMQGATSLEDVVVDDELTWSDSITPTHEVFEIDQPTGDTVTCMGPPDRCGGVPSFRTMVDRKTAISVSWGDEAKVDTLTQYAYRIMKSGDVDLPVPWRWNGGGTGFELEESEDSVCYVLELQKLVDGTIQTFDQQCVERPDTFTPGLHPNPEENIRSVLAACDTPPDGYTDLWCSARSEHCLGEMPNALYCERFAELCSDDGGEGGAAGAPTTGGSAGSAGSGGSAGSSAGSGGAPRGGSAGQGVTGGSSGSGPGAGGSGPTGGSNDGDAGEASDDGGGERVYTKGCGCAFPGTSSDQRGALLASALGLAVLAVRRRRR